MTTNPSDAPQGTPNPENSPTPPPPPPGGYQGGGHGQPGGQAGYGQPGYDRPAPGQPSTTAYGNAGSAQPPLSDSDQRLWATLAHILPIIGLSFLAPLVIWLVFKDRGRFVDEQAKEALNFQITLAIAAIGISIIGTITFGIGFILYLAFIVALVWMIMAAVAVNRGDAYRYPVNVRLVK
jgi:uncharacterized protein